MLGGIITKLANQPRQLFLLDSMGGMTSAVVPMVILWNFESKFGLPRELLIAMSLTGFLYGTYSLICAMRIKLRWVFFLKALVLGNCAYLLSIMAYTVVSFSSLTPLGLIYLLIDHLVLLSVITLETAVIAAISGLWIPGSRS